SREAVEAAFFDPAGLDAMAQAGTDLSSMRVHDVDEPLREHAKVATSRLAATQCRRFEKMPPPSVETSQNTASTTRSHSQPTTAGPFVFQRITYTRVVSGRKMMPRMGQMIGPKARSTQGVKIHVSARASRGEKIAMNSSRNIVRSLSPPALPR